MIATSPNRVGDPTSQISGSRSNYVRDTGNVCVSLEPMWFTRHLVKSYALSCLSAALVAAVEFTWHPPDADSDVARQTYRCKTSDLGQESEVAGSSKVEAWRY